ncbi:hypothetical protein OG589_05505 [Sphaerisporangium sp. NBC_01403]|uniref:hypothetical protein n=1 Tax=Sphaerisporangium sp. NBC_01403 TaxID=2903599 RepID=UPI00325153C4
MRRKPGRAVAVLIATAAAAVSMAATPAMAASWKLVEVFPTSGECYSAGDAYVRVHYAQKYQCKWDSPGFGLWLYR